MVVAVLRPIDTQPSKRYIDDLLIEKPDQRRDAGYFATSRVLLERGLHLRVRGAKFRIGRPETLLDHAVKRFGIFGAPFAAREHAGKSQEGKMPRSLRRPVAHKERRGRYLAHRRDEYVCVNICRCAIEALLEPDRLAGLVDAWRDSCEKGLDCLPNIRPVSGSIARAAVMASGQSQSTSVLPYLSPRSSPMFCGLPLKYRGAKSMAISSRSHPWRTVRFDRYGTGTGENPF